MLQPRVAVVLNVPQPWHPWLFALRLCSILPALWWGLPSLLRLLLYFLPGPPDQFMLVKQIAVPGSNIDVLQSTSTSSCSRSDGEAASAAAAAAAAVLAAPYAITETALATIWVRTQRLILVNEERDKTPTSLLCSMGIELELTVALGSPF